jgi:hypothetical protein
MFELDHLLRDIAAPLVDDVTYQLARSLPNG